MPLFAFHCETCDADFETLMRASDTPECPKCASQTLRRLPSRVAPDLNFPKVAKATRCRRKLEGHLSNFTRAETPRAAPSFVWGLRARAASPNWRARPNRRSA
ncbi:zinc ribbon domain-containing protein [Methylocella sp.]|uniref:zinc ribbon domain-containing protein n=1 Tax=Methylocella sp. TaxID=1978226 RepID=UPI003784D1EF